MHEVNLEFDLDDNPDLTWHVCEMDLHEKLAEIFLCRLRVAHAEDSAPAVPALLGSSCCVTISRELEEGLHERKVRGVISRVVEVGNPGTHGYAHFRLEVVPAMWALSKKSGARMYQGKTAPDIIVEVVKDGIAPFGRAEPEKKLQRTDYPERDYCLQYGESDLDFVSRLMQEEGISFYFDHSGDKEKVVLTDDNNKMIIDPELGDLANLPGLPLLISFAPAAQMRSTEFHTYDYNWRTPEQKNEDSSGDDDGSGMGRYDPDNPISFADGDDKADQARLQWEAEKCAASIHRGESRLTNLMPGQHRKLISGGTETELVITSVRATGRNPGPPGEDNYEFDYRNTYWCVPKDVPWRPNRNLPRPKVSGYQTAVVVGEGDETITSNDGLGRVKVRFHWDREQKTSTWIPVAQAWAGANFGAFFLPRKGMQVAVVFLNGDPDRPMVVGCLHHDLAKPPFTLPDQKSKSGIRTRSMESGVNQDKGANELFFEDDKGKEEIYLKAQHDMNTVVQHNQTVVVGDKALEPYDDATKRGQLDGFGLNPAGNRTIMVGKDAAKKGGANCVAKSSEVPEIAAFDRDQAAEGNLWQRVMANQYEEVQGNQCRIVGTAPGDATKGNDYTEIYGNQKLTVHGDQRVEIFGHQTVKVHQPSHWWHGFGWDFQGYGGFIGRLYVGLKLSIYAGAAVNFYAAKVDIIPGAKFEAVGAWKGEVLLGKKWKFIRGEAAEVAAKKKVELGMQNSIKKNAGDIAIIAGCKLNVDEAAENLAAAKTSMVAQATTIAQATALTAGAAVLGMAAVQSAAVKARQAAIKAKLDKAISVADKAETTGQMILKEKEVLIKCGKSEVTVKGDGSVLIKSEKNMVGITGKDKVEIKASGGKKFIVKKTKMTWDGDTVLPNLEAKK